MSVSDWLEHVIREEALKSGHETSPAHDTQRSDLRSRLQRLSRSGSGAAMERGARHPAGGHSRSELDTLLEQAAQLELRTRDAEATTTTALESIVEWIEKAESRMAAAERAAAERQERATSVIADAIKTVSSRVSDVERKAQVGSSDAYAAPGLAAQAGAARRPALSREGLGHAISDIQNRQRELEAGPDRRRPAAVMQNLREDLGRVVGLPHGERRMGERRADVTPLMNGLRADLAQLRSEIAGLASTPASSRLEDSIRELAQRLDTREAAPLDELARPLARIEAELSRLQQQDPSNRFGRIESEIQRLGARIEDLASHAHEPRLIAAAVQELTGLKDALSRTAQTPRLDDLSTQIGKLAHDIGRVREEIGRANPAGEVERAIEDMREALLRETRDASGIGQGLLQRIERQMETVSAAISQIPAGGVGEREDFSLLSHKLDQLAQRTQPESDALAQRIEDLALKLDDMSGQASAQLMERVDRLSDQIESLAQRGPAAIEQQIDKLSSRIEAMAAPSASAGHGIAKVDLTPIEDMIAELARKLEDASRPETEARGLQALERQIAALADRLDTRPEAAGASDGLERTLQDLMRSLGGLRDETASAVDRAARAAVADAMTRSPSAATAMPDLSGLRDDLAGLKDVHVSIDKRTHSAIGAVNDTLEKIVQRLAQLEDDMAREREAAPPAPSAGSSRFLSPSELDAYSAEPLTAPARSAEPRAVRAGSLEAESGPRIEAPTTPEPSRPAARSGPRNMIAAAQRALRSGSAQAETAPPEPKATRTEPARAVPAPTEPALARQTTLDLAETPTDALPDMPLEPGSGRPRGRSEGAMPTSPSASGINPSLIAAARRAAMAASAEAEALKGSDKAEAKAKGRFGLPASLRETLEKRRKPILLGLAAIILAIGASQVATTLLPDAPPTREARQQGAAEAPVAERRAEPRAAEPASAQPAPAIAPAPPKDQTSMSSPQPERAVGAAPASGPDVTGSVRPIEMAALPPPDLGPDASRFAAPSSALAPGRVTNLGELAPTIGTPGMRRAALEGDPNAVHELAVRASDGIGMARDQKLALRLFERAAAAGHAPSQFRVANMHEKGIGTARDAKLAMSWYRRAAERGNAKAMHNLAVLIAEGADGRPDYAAAAELFRKGAEHGVRDSQFNLAILLGRGLGVEQDLTQSYTWFAVAARQGDADAAKKRDEVGARLTPVDLAAGRTASLEWKPKPLDPAANEVAAPAQGWDAQPKTGQKPPVRPRTT
jgi:localization factor PodJL